MGSPYTCNLAILAFTLLGTPSLGFWWSGLCFAYSVSFITISPSPARGRYPIDLGSRALSCCFHLWLPMISEHFPRERTSLLNLQSTNIPPFPYTKPSSGSTPPTGSSPNSFLVLFQCASATPTIRPTHTNCICPHSSDKSHQAARDSSVSLGCLSPPLSGKLLLMRHCPTSLSPVVSFPCSHKLGKCLLPQTLLPLCSLVVLKHESASTSPGGLLKHSFLGSTPRIYGSVGMIWSLRMCISKRAKVMPALSVHGPLLRTAVLAYH